MSDSAPLVRLTRSADQAALIDAFADAHGGRIGLAGVLATRLDSTAKVLNVPAYAASYGFTWQDDESGDRDWWPQGITTSADASPDGLVNGREVALVSWYAKGKHHPPYDVRVSVVDVTHRATPRYTQVGLIALTGGADGVGHEAVRVHAGGLVWHGSHLYVADTSGGLRVFDLDDIIEVSMECGHRHLCLPQRTAFAATTADGETPFRWSFLALDRHPDRDLLIAGEYGIGKQTTRLATFNLDETGAGALVDTVGHTVSNTQGAVRVGEQWLLSTSHGARRRGTMWIGPAGRLAPCRSALAVGPEDLTYWRQHDEIWNVSEHPGQRFVYAMRRDAFEQVAWKRRVGNAKRVVSAIASLLTLP